MNRIRVIGVDVAQDHLDLAVSDTPQQGRRVPNSPTGFDAVIALARRGGDEDARVICEATGGHEWGLIGALNAAGVRVHRVQPLVAKHFTRSLGPGKTDALDAQALARYGVERGDRLVDFVLPDQAALRLKAQLSRRDDLVAMRVAEQARLKSPPGRLVAHSLTAMIAVLDDQIAALDRAIDAALHADPALQAKRATLTAITGIGPQTAAALLTCMPELGALSRREAASLAGLAPHPKDSGKTTRYRSTGRGRSRVKRALFLAAMAARNHDPKLKAFYERLIANGKPKMTALTAVMRKLITHANAKIRDAQRAQQTG